MERFKSYLSGVSSPVWQILVECVTIVCKLFLLSAEFRVRCTLVVFVAAFVGVFKPLRMK